MKRFLSGILYPVVLACLSGFIAIRNYVPDTWLTGWDTLHPEVDFSLNLQRLVQGVWRYDQGLGAVAGHSHMADLPRVLFMQAVQNFVQPDFLRYSYVFLMFVIGPIGVYFLLGHILKLRTHLFRHIAFISSALYVFNLGTVQQFYVPFEMFPTQWGYLPWIMLLVLHILESGKIRYLLLFVVVNFLAAPQAYAAQLWYAFFGVLTLFLITYTLYHKRQGIHIRRSFIVIGLLLITNSFWLLPNVYYISNESASPRYAKQNRLSSEEFRLRNRQFGKLDDVALARGFYMDWSVYDHENESFTQLMPAWRSHFDKPSIQMFGYIIFTMVLAGMFVSVRRHDKLFTSFLPFFFVPFILLANRVFPFNFIFDGLTSISIFEEALRFVFTKFSILLIFSYVLYFSYALYILTKNLSGITRTALYAGIFIALTWYVSPVFAGNLISDKVEKQIPEKYFEAWDFMNTQNDGRVLTLPLHSIAGWQYYEWGYQGSGFIWFGIPQQVLDRDSDRWNYHNEQAFREHSYALYARDPEIFLDTLRKYNIEYVLWDQSVMTTEEKNNNQILFTRETEELLGQLQQDGSLSQLQTFDDVIIYKVADTQHGYIAQGKPANIGPYYIWNFRDFAYQKFGTYITDKDEPEDVTYLFRTFLNRSDRLDPNVIAIDNEADTYTIMLDEQNFDNKFISMPDVTFAESAIDVKVFIENDNGTYKLVLLPFFPEDIRIKATARTTIPSGTTSLSLNGESYSFELSQANNKPLELGENTLLFTEDNYINGSVAQFDITYPTSGAITQFSSELPRSFTRIEAADIFDQTTSGGDYFLLEEAGKKFTRFIANEDEANGFFVPLSSLSHAKGYIIQISSRNVTGTPLRICLFNDYTNRCTLLDELSAHNDFGTDTFIVPSTDETIGYSLRIDNLSFGGFESMNDIMDISIIPLPYNFLSQIHLQDSDFESNLAPYADLNRVNNFIFTGKLEYFQNNDTSTLVLHQAYNDGWEAFAVENTTGPNRYFPFFTGRKLLNHVLVNNWANGWVLDINDLPPGSRKNDVVMIFVPQYLEYLGFLLFGWVFVSLIVLVIVKYGYANRTRS